MIPSLRRPNESLIPIPLPTVRTRQQTIVYRDHSTQSLTVGQVIQLPCDLSILMCDPEWKIKTGAEILVYIHRPEEDFSDLLSRWRQTQVLLSQNYEWLMPLRHRHIVSEGADEIYPLFVVFPETVERIKRGLKGGCLPFIIQDLRLIGEVTTPEPLSSEGLGVE
jgi:hypothetical protein